MSSRWPPSVAVAWAHAHDLRWRVLPILLALWCASAASCWIGLPVASTVDADPVDLQVFGPLVLGVTAGVSSLLLHDASPWLAAASPRRLALVRAGWAGLLLIGSLGLGGLSTGLLPAALPPVTGFLIIGMLWWAVATIGGVVGGKLAGLLGPVAGAVVFTRLIPWDLNIVYRSDLVVARVVAAAVLSTLAALGYGLAGSAYDRRHR